MVRCSLPQLLHLLALARPAKVCDQRPETEPLLRPIVLSLQPKWACLIRSGEKKIELRRRFPRKLGGSIAYIYEALPTCSLTSIIHLGEIHELPVDTLWRKYGAAACVDQEHFASYFQHRDVGFAIEVVRYVPLSQRWDLASLRNEFGFTAPQSWAYASPKLVGAVGTTS